MEAAIFMLKNGALFSSPAVTALVRSMFLPSEDSWQQSVQSVKLKLEPETVALWWVFETAGSFFTQPFYLVGDVFTNSKGLKVNPNRRKLSERFTWLKKVQAGCCLCIRWGPVCGTSASCLKARRQPDMIYGVLKPSLNSSKANVLCDASFHP